MIEKILDPECPLSRVSDSMQHAKPHRIDGAQRSQNLARAWKRVKANKGAPGIDGMTVADFPAFAREHWPRIASAIREGTYRPAPVRRVWIPKPDGSKRPLGAERSESGGLEKIPPTSANTDGAGPNDPAGRRASAGAAFRGLLQRTLIRAARLRHSPLAGHVAALLSKTPPRPRRFCHGYRPGRSALEAVAAMETGWKEGRRHAVECDLKSFFDTVDHDRLMNALKEKVRCRKTLGLI